jgi:hypothetical protein
MAAPRISKTVAREVEMAAVKIDGSLHSTSPLWRVALCALPLADSDS